MALGRPVVRALDDLSESVNGLSLAHPLDRQKAISMFVYLFERNERPHPDDVKHWALDQGWDDQEARDLGNLVDDVQWVMNRLDRGQGWGRPDFWCAEA
jgi:hypothetical protein